MMPSIAMLSTKMLNITIRSWNLIIKSAQIVSFEDHDAQFDFRRTFLDLKYYEIEFFSFIIFEFNTNLRAS